MIQTVGLSDVGGLNSTLLAHMGDGVAILTNYRVPTVAVLPHTNDIDVARSAAATYVSKLYTDDKIPKAGRTKGKLITLLRQHRILTVLKSGRPVAILLLTPHSQEARERNAKLYMQALNHDDVPMPTLQPTDTS